MNILQEFIDYILENTTRAKRVPGSSWQTKKGWYAKNPTGERRQFGVGPNAEKSAEVWAQGSKRASTQVSQPEPKKRRGAQASVPTRGTSLPQAAEVPTSKSPGRIPAKPLNKTSAVKDTAKLAATEAVMNSRGFASVEDKKRFSVTVKLWKSFLGATTYEEQVRAVKALADQKLIEGHAGGKKIYMTPITGLIPKHMCGNSGTSVTRLMNQIIQDEHIELTMRGGSADRALAAASGYHNEHGVTYHLFPSEENKALYAKIEERYVSLGGDATAADERNKIAAEAVKQALPKGAKIIGCTQVGALGPIKLKQLGINPKTDPTDMLLEYTVGSKSYMMKISAKIYTDPRNITMKNSGVTKAGVDYLGEPEGSVVDEQWKVLYKQNRWTPDMSEGEKKDKKSALKQGYLKLFASEMERLSKTSDGQKRLLNMWRSVHGCGMNVHTLIIDKATNQSSLKAPAHYCEPKTPFKVKYDGVKVVIEMSTGGPQTLQIDLKTEDKGSPKLLFRHIVRGKK